MTPAGDVVAAELRIKLMASGALMIEGPIADPQWCLEVLAAAADYIRNTAKPKDQLVIPSKDVELLLPGGAKVKL